VAARLPHEILTFTEANHAFFDDTNPPPRFNVQAAEEAYRRTFGWFDKFLDEDDHHHGKKR
jgi:carboxymethylenebutenolidase